MCLFIHFADCLIQASDTAPLAALASFSPAADNQFDLKQTEAELFLFCPYLTVSPSVDLTLRGWRWRQYLTKWSYNDISAKSTNFLVSLKISPSLCLNTTILSPSWHLKRKHIFMLQYFIFSDWPPGLWVSISEVEGGTLKQHPGAGPQLVVNHTGLSRQGVHPQQVWGGGEGQLIIITTASAILMDFS